MSSTKQKLVLICTTTWFAFFSLVSPVFAAISYSYDANGNLLSDGSTCYKYNDANQLSRVYICASNAPIADYNYNSTGDRIVKKIYTNGTLSQTVYSPEKEYETIKLANGTTQNSSYYYANDQLIAKKAPDGTKTYYQNDQLGSSSLTTNATGGVVENSTYLPFGEVRSGGILSKYQFTGQEKDNESGLNYYGARYYNSHLAHFTQPDTLLPDLYDPQQLNRYAYAKNNPIKFTDPSGHFVKEINLFATEMTLLSIGTSSFMSMATGWFVGGFLIGGGIYGAAYCWSMSTCPSSTGLGHAALLGAQMAAETPYVKVASALAGTFGTAKDVFKGDSMAVDANIYGIDREHLTQSLFSIEPYDPMKDPDFYSKMDRNLNPTLPTWNSINNPVKANQSTSTKNNGGFNQTVNPTGAAKSFINFGNTLANSSKSQNIFSNLTPSAPQKTVSKSVMDLKLNW